MTPALATLDELRPAEPDPANLERNLAALGQLAGVATTDRPIDRLRRVAWPAGWQSGLALDDFPTWRTPDALWPDGSALPRERAVALLRNVPVAGETNVALAAAGDGGMLAVLLEYLSPRQAVYLFDAADAPLAYLLRVMDWSRDIAAGRFLPIPGDDADWLQRLLTRHPGLDLPTQVIAPPHLPRARVDAVTQLVRQAGEARPGGVPAAASGDSRPRAVALCRESQGPAAHLARELEQAAERRRLPVLTLSLGSPLTAGQRHLRQRLAAAAPAISLCIGHAPRQLVVPLPGRVCEWRLARPVEPPADDDGLQLAATPTVAADLRRGGLAPERIVEWFLAAPHVEPPDSPAESDPGALALLADRRDASAAACGISQPTHRLLWQALHKLAAERWVLRAEIPFARGGWQAGPSRFEPLLLEAEGMANARLSEPALRRRMLQLIELCLIPALEAERIHRALLDGGPTNRDHPDTASRSWGVLRIGVGWRPDVDGPVLAAQGCDLLESQWSAPPLAAIAAYQTDPLRPEVLLAAAHGWPLLIHTPGGGSLDQQMDGLLLPQQHYLPFSTTAELRAAIQTIADRPEAARKRAARAAEHLRRSPGYGERLEQLLRRA